MADVTSGGELASLRQELNELRQRHQVLEDKEAVRDVLYQYGLRFDLDRRDEWFELFADDCYFSTDVPGFLLKLNGIKEIKEHYTPKPGQAPPRRSGNEPPKYTGFMGHVELAGVIRVDGDNAHAVGWQVGTGVRTWKLRRTNGKWLITETLSRVMGDKERCREIVPERF